MSIEGDSTPQTLSFGAEAVDFTRAYDASHASDIAVTQLTEYTLNRGTIRIKSDAPYIPLVIMYEKPSHFSNYPRANAQSYAPWDVIVSPETGLDARNMADHLAGEQLNNTRYIFPNDGLILNEAGFSDELIMSEVIAQAIEEKSKIPHYELFHASRRSGVHRWIGQHMIKNLNSIIGPIPEANQAPPPKAEQQVLKRPRTRSQAEEFARIAVALQAIQNPLVIYSSERHKIVQQMDAYVWENSPKRKTSWYS